MLTPPDGVALCPTAAPIKLRPPRVYVVVDGFVVDVEIDGSQQGRQAFLRDDESA